MGAEGNARVETVALEDAPGLEPAQTLTAALTVESLLLAAFSLAFSLAKRTKKGQHPFFAQGWFAWCIAFVIFFAAVSAGASLYAVYESDDPGGWIDWLRVVGIALAIVAQPLVAFAFAAKAKPDTDEAS